TPISPPAQEECCKPCSMVSAVSISRQMALYNSLPICPQAGNHLGSPVSDWIIPHIPSNNSREFNFGRTFVLPPSPYPLINLLILYGAILRLLQKSISKSIRAHVSQRVPDCLSAILPHTFRLRKRTLRFHQIQHRCHC